MVLIEKKRIKKRRIMRIKQSYAGQLKADYSNCHKNYSSNWPIILYCASFE